MVKMSFIVMRNMMKGDGLLSHSLDINEEDNDRERKEDSESEANENRDSEDDSNEGIDNKDNYQIDDDNNDNRGYDNEASDTGDDNDRRIVMSKTMMMRTVKH